VKALKSFFCRSIILEKCAEEGQAIWW